MLIILKIQIREGLFSEDDLKQLEGGYSVSETDEDMGSAMNDILSAHSYYQNKARGVLDQPGELPLFSPLLAGSPGAPHHWEEGYDPAIDHKIRFQ